MDRDLGEKKMSSLGETYYNLGIKLLETGEYELAVCNLVNAYEVGYDRKKILEYLYSRFILPNEDEFKCNYYNNCVQFTKVPYEKLRLDFIPISSNKFYVYDKEQQEFAGIFEMDEEPVRGVNLEFHSVLCTDIWDIREIVPILKSKQWSTVYILLNDLEEKFAAFLKLPNFTKIYLEYVILFKDLNLMHAFFSEYEEFYLPKKLLSAEPEKYENLIRQLHDKRIFCMPKENKNVFLSICIPSYNRGTAALKNVKHLLQCPYDSEIEIIVSNNGSLKDIDGYKEIQSLRDSRVRYSEFDVNQGYATNVIKVLEMAKGKYAVLVSDEDLMVIENLGEYLSYLRENETGGVFRSNVIGPNSYFAKENEKYNFGVDAIKNTLNLNYITGITYNMELLRNLCIFDIIANLRGNEFLEAYIHIVLATIAGRYGNFHVTNLTLWLGEKPREEKVKENDYGIRSYMFPESRIKQLRDALKLINQCLNLKQAEVLYLFLERCEKVYGLLRAAYSVFRKFEEVYTWEDTCMYVYREEIKFLEELSVESNKEKIEKDLMQMLFWALDNGAIFQKDVIEDRQKKRLLHQLIQIELENYGRSLVKINIDKDLRTIINDILQELVGVNESILNQKEAQEAVAQGKILEYLYIKRWEEKGQQMKIVAWDK